VPCTSAAYQLPAYCKSLAFAPSPASPEKSCHAAAGQDFSLAMRKAQALAFFVLIIN